MPKNFIRNLTGSQRSRKSDVQLGLTLAFVAGAMNAGGFFAVKSYTSHMTGIVSSMADYIVVHHYAAALLAFLYFFSFLCGAIASAIIINWARARKFNGEYAFALMFEAFLLLLFGIFAANLSGGDSIHITVYLLCFIMGLQNALITKISNAEIRTTHVTGLTTDIGIDIGRFIYARSSGHPEIITQFSKLKLRAGLLGLFFIGGIIGGAMFLTIGYAATIPFAAILAILASVPIMDDLKLRT